MIWLLLTLFVPGGLNQGISVDTPTSFTYNVVYPCDGTNVSAVIPSRTQGYLNQYNLLIVTPPWGLDLDLKFDSDVTLELIKVSKFSCRVEGPGVIVGLRPTEVAVNARAKPVRVFFFGASGLHHQYDEFRPRWKRERKSVSDFY